MRGTNLRKILLDYGHALGHVLFERVVLWRPFWLAEGAAEYVRRFGRQPEKESLEQDELFPAEDLLTIVPSASYKDDAPATSFRLLAYRLTRILTQEDPSRLKQLVRALAAEDGKEERLDVDLKSLNGALVAYAEAAPEFSRIASEIRVREVDEATVSLHRGDLLVAAGRSRDADRWYAGETVDARVARAILSKLTRPLSDVRFTLDRAAREFPDSGLVQYHYGTLESRSDAERTGHTAALERAVRLLPRMGRAHAALARLYAQGGQGLKALDFARKAIELEPEYADRFYEVLAEVRLSLGNSDEAFQAIRLADELPHADREASEYFTRRVAAVRRDIENRRREIETVKAAELRRKVEEEVNRREPPKPPAPPPPPVRPGSISYTIEGRFGFGVQPPEVESPFYPDYPEPMRKAGTQGKIILQVDIDPAGKVKQARVASSSVPDLNDPTLASVKQWTFKPAQRAGKPVDVRLTLTLSFSLQ